MLGEILYEWRYAKRLSLREAAQKIGINHSTLSRIENGKPIDSKIMLFLINKLFEVKESEDEKK